MKNLLFIYIIVLFFGCHKKDEPKTVLLNNRPELEILDTIEVFKDSMNFGQKQNNKIEICKIEIGEDVFAKVYLYEKKGKHWEIAGTLSLEAVRINDLATRIEDFNNDGFKDVIFTTGMAGRGGNNVQSLILFSPIDKSLKWIKNSERFPNLMYNEKLDCIDSCMLTGGQTTYFLKISGDSLKEFASVDQRDGRIIAEIIDANGKWKEIANSKDDPEGFDRFINYDPVEKRKE